MMIQLPVDYTTLSPTQRRLVWEHYIQQQQGLCQHCGQLLSGEPAPNILALWINTRLFPPSFFKWSVHLHHDHKSGMTIGAVHSRCNAVLWQYFGQ